VFAVVIGLLTAGLCVGAFILTADAFDGVVSLRVRRGGRITLSGWQAYLHGIGSALLVLATALGTVGLFAVAFGPQRWGSRALSMFRVAYASFVAGACVITFVLIAWLFT
jgi:hypothetical protein